MGNLKVFVGRIHGIIHQETLLEIADNAYELYNRTIQIWNRKRNEILLARNAPACRGRGALWMLTFCVAGM